MSTGTYLSAPVLRAADANGAPLAGALLQFYLTGTTTPTPVYSSAVLSTPLSNPVVADSGGLFAPIFLDPAVTYRCQLQTSGGTIIRDIDPVAAPQTIASGAITAAMLANGAAVSNIGYTPLNKAGDTATNLLLSNSTLATNSAGYLGTPVNEQDANYALVLSDAGKMVRCNSASAVAYTVPPVSSVPFPIGTTIVFRNLSAGGTLTITRGIGVVIWKALSNTSQDVAIAPRRHRHDDPGIVQLGDHRGGHFVSGATSALLGSTSGAAGGTLATPVWTNIFGTDVGATNNQTLSGFTGTLSISAANSGGGTLSYIHNGATAVYSGAFSVAPGDVLAWSIAVGLSTKSGTITVTNVTASATLQAISYTVLSSGGGGGIGNLP